MGLETGTYISDLVSTNPTASDPKSQGDDHVRLIKACAKATFPNVSNAITATHTELNYSVGVTSAIQTQINAKGAITGQAWTGSHTFVTQSAADNSTKAATTAYVDAADALKANLASPALTGTPTAPTAAGGTNTTQVATTAFVVQQAFSAALPVQSGNAGKVLSTDGANASWTVPPSAPDVIVQCQRASGAGGAALTASAQNTRVLNTIVRNNGSIASLATNAITLPAGTYYARGSASMITGSGGTPKSVASKLRLYNSTDSSVIAAGIAAASIDNSTDGVQSPATVHVQGYFTLAGSKAIVSQMYVGNTNATVTEGNAVSSGDAEVYATVEIWKVL